VRTLREPIDPAPFLRWLYAEGTRRQVGTDALAAPAWPGERDDTVARRLRRWAGLDHVERAVVQTAVENLDGDYHDLYGEDVARLPSGRRRPSHAGIPMTVSEDVLIRAHRLHIDEGYSLRKLGRVLHHETTAKNPEALARILHNAFLKRGWETTGRSEAIAAFNRAKVDHLPFCTHIHAIGELAGQRCVRRTSHGTCWHHDPERLAERLAELEARLRPGEQAAA
jgi:hypothetical protein